MLGLGNSITTLPYVEGVAPYSNTYSLSLVTDNQADGGDSFNTNQSLTSMYTDTFSASFWVKPDDGRKPSSNQIFGNVAAGTSFLFSINGNGYLGVFLLVNGKYIIGSATNGRYDDGAASDFSNVVIVVNKNTGSNTSVKVYKDGVRLAMSPFSNVTDTDQASMDFGSATTRIGWGGTSPTTANRFIGNIDEAAFFNTELDDDNVAAIHNGGTPFDLTSDNGNYNSSGNLLSYYRFENNTDDTQGVSNGTLVGSDAAFEEDTP